MGCPLPKEQKHDERKVEYDLGLGNGKKKIQPTCRTNEMISDKKVLSRYEVKQIIGTGTFSNVFRVECKASKYPYAVKMIGLRTIKDIELFNAEKSVLMSVEHKYIVKFHEIIESQFSAYIIMELATGGDLLEKIQVLGKICEKETIRILRMLLDAVCFLHQKHITHRDLKPENILFYTPGEESRIVLTDFGFASYRDTNAKMLSTYCGTLQYLSPEIISEEQYTNKVDVWSIGVIVYFMLGGYLPFVSNDVAQLSHMITSVPHTFNREIWKTISDDGKKFINSCLVKNPTHRIDSQTAFEHVWLQVREKTESNEAYQKSINKASQAAHTVRSQNCNLINCHDNLTNESVIKNHHTSRSNFKNKPTLHLDKDSKSSLVIDFDSSTNILSKSDILAQSFISSCETQSNSQSIRTPSFHCDGNSKKILEKITQEKTPVENDSLQHLIRKCSPNRLPPIKPYRKKDRKFSCQEDYSLYRTFEGLFNPIDNRKHPCNPGLFSADIAPRKNAWLPTEMNSNVEKHMREIPTRSRRRNIITAELRPPHSKYRRSQSADSKIPHSV